MLFAGALAAVVLDGMPAPQHILLLPLSEQYRLDHYGDEIPPANSKFGTSSHRRRLALTTENTRPIRLHIDYSSLYEETSKPYGSCFTVGAWYARGLPGPTPPTSAVQATCTGEPTDQDCWGICQQRDLITPTGRQQIIDVVDRVVAEVSSFFALLPEDGPLTFERSEGRYRGALAAKGYPPQTACARDCAMLNALAPDDRTYCGDGVQADAVFSVTKAPTLAGVAGTGGASPQHSASLNR